LRPGPGRRGQEGGIFLSILGRRGRAARKGAARALEAEAALPEGLLGRGIRERLGRQPVAVLVLVASDVALALLMWSAAIALRYLWLGSLPLMGLTLSGVAANTVVWVLLRAGRGLYPGYGLDQVQELKRQTYATLSAFAIHLCGAFVLQLGDSISRLVFVSGFAGLLVAAPFGRHFAKWALMRAGLWGRPVLVVGASGDGERLIGDLRREWGMGFRPVAVFDDDFVPEGGAVEGVPYGGGLREARALAQERKVGTLVVAMDHSRQERAVEIMREASSVFRHVIFISQLNAVTNSATEARYLSGTLGLEVKHNLLDPWAVRAKRALDLLLAAALTVVLSPLILLIALLIKLDSPGPVIYGHVRLGAGNTSFRCWKFRTMYEDADRLLHEHLLKNEHLRIEWELNQKLRNDPRVTRIGRFLRKTSLDELPQIWNVIKGEMSLVGPRPIVDSEVVRYGETYDLYRRVKPGISGLWQVSGRNDTSYSERVGLDVHYIMNWSVWLDLIILARTVRCVLLRKGAY